MTNTSTTDAPAKPRGFAAMDPEKRREIARKGGKALDPSQRSFSANKELARAAGAKGGKSVNPANRSFSRDNDLAKSAGIKGGRAAHKAEG